MHRLTSYQQEALRYDKHISLVANAGSGKTFVLAKRYVDIAVKEKISLSKIVAITFTDKAAGELYKKISKEIEERLTSSQNGNEIFHLKRIREQLVSANISTIHSFCINILKEFPTEAGIDANFMPIDKALSEELIELSIEEFINSNLRNDNSEKIKKMIRLLGSHGLFISQLKLLMDKREIISKLGKTLYNKDTESIKNIFFNSFIEIAQKVIDENFEIIALIENINNAVLREDGKNEIATEVKIYLDNFFTETKYIDKFLVLKLILQKIIISTGKLRERGYLKKSLRKDFEEEIAFVERGFRDIKYFEIIEEHNEATTELAEFGKFFVDLFSDVVSIYQKKKSDNGYLDFEDILLFAKNILGQPEVKKSLSKRIKYIMIDEYQDTNETQYNIFMPILNNLKNGNLFVVGDEKQSIYMFRDAELKIFNKTRYEIEDKTGSSSLLRLPHSFRVSPPIALFVNKLFENLFLQPDEVFNEVAESKLICAKDEEETGSIGFLLTDEEIELQSELVAKKILLLVKEEKEIEYNDIAILCRKRKDFFELEETFSKLHIPFAIVGGKGFYQHQIVYDVHNYLEFLVNPNNSVALIGLLRSPFYLLSDTVLFKINLEKGKTFFEKLENYSASNKEYEDILDLLKLHIAMAGKIELSILIETLFTTTGYWAVISALESNQQEIANAEKLISIALNFSKSGLKTLYDFTDFLQDAIESNEDEGQAQVNTEQNAVKIMTIHQSKGLEYKTVFLYNTNSANKDFSIKAKTLTIDKDYGIFTKLPLTGNFTKDYVAAPVVGAFNYLRKRKNVAEDKRLLYVAVTRAISNLYICATVENDKVTSDSFFSLVIEGLGIKNFDEEFNLTGNLKFLDFNTYTDLEKRVEIKIPFTKSIELRDDNEEEIEEEYSCKEILIEEIKDVPEQEIISATKIALYSQCPVKYELNYELGYSRLYNMFSSKSSFFEFENGYEEKEEKSIGKMAATKGSIIHELLEKYKSYNEAIEGLNEIIENSVNNFEYTEALKFKLKEDIEADLKKYFSSEIFKKINSFANYKCEFEIYLKFKNFYLYGIIDRLIFEKEKIIIIDYKTDNIKIDEIETRAENYVPQLMFYAFILSRYKREVKSFELWLSFVKHPEKPYKKNVSIDDLKDFETVINTYIINMQNSYYEYNFLHCSKCNFYNDKKCIKLEYS